MVSDSRQELQNQVVHEVSKRKTIDHCRDLHGATIKHSHQYLILTMLISSSANVREREKSAACQRTFYCSNLVKLGADNCHFL